MKRKIFIIAFFSLFITLFYSGKTTTFSQQLRLENIEALGSGETPNQMCIPGGSWKCGGGSNGSYVNYA